MNFVLTYTGAPGSVTASLTSDDKPIDSTIVTNERAARRWARKRAKEYRTELAIEKFRNHSVYTTISGGEGFTL